MKRLIPIVLIFLLISGCGKKEQKDLYVWNTHSMSFKNSAGEKVYTEDMIIIANQEVKDKEEYAAYVLERIQKNELNNMMLSTDIAGWPAELNVTIYEDEKAKEKNKQLFRFSYTQDISYQYNIKDNPEKFTLEIK